MRTEKGRFAPGVSGNPDTRFSAERQPKNRNMRGGRHLGLLYAELDKKVLVSKHDKYGNVIEGEYVETTKAHLVLEQLVDMAIGGSEFAQALIFERTEGKVTTNPRDLSLRAADEGGLPSVSEAMERYLAAIEADYPPADPVKE